MKTKLERLEKRIARRKPEERVFILYSDKDNTETLADIARHEETFGPDSALVIQYNIVNRKGE